MKQSDKKKRLLVFDIAVGLVTVALIAFGLWTTFGKKSDQPCTAPGQEHVVTVKNDAFSTDQLTLTQCDSIKVVDAGSEDYDMFFGTHDHHVTYPGFSGQEISPNEFFVIDAVQAGSYEMHDHLRDKAKIVFDIRAKQQ